MEILPTPLPDWIVLSCERIEPTGSRIICNPPPTDTDMDWLCLLHVNMDMEDFQYALETDKWDDCKEGSQPYPEDELWCSYRKGVDNVIVTQDVTFFNLFMEATRQAKEQNLLLKSDRIALFNTVLGKEEKKKVVKPTIYGGTSIHWSTLATNWIHSSGTTSTSDAFIDDLFATSKNSS